MSSIGGCHPTNDALDNQVISAAGLEESGNITASEPHIEDAINAAKKFTGLDRASNMT